MTAEYQHIRDPMTGQLSETVYRYADGAHIPNDLANVDRQVYEQYVADGGSTDPAAPPSRAGVIAQSSQSLKVSHARALNSQGRTQEAVDMILDHLEGNT